MKEECKIYGYLIVISKFAIRITLVLVFVLNTRTYTLSVQTLKDVVSILFIKAAQYLYVCCTICPYMSTQYSVHQGCPDLWLRSQI